MQIFDRRTVAIPGPAGDASPEMIAAAEVQARLTAETAVEEMNLPEQVTSDVAQAVSAENIPGRVASAVADENIPGQIATQVPPLVSAAMAQDPTVEQALLDGVEGAIENLDLGRSIGVQTSSAFVRDANQIGAIAFEGSRSQAAKLYDDGHVVWTSEERTDLRADDDVIAVFAHRDDLTVVSKILSDGRVVSGDDGTVTASYGVAFGDSTTQGADLVSPATERWTTLLATLTGQTFENRGRSGARSDEIAWYAGAVTATGIPTGGSIPASGTVTITGLDVDPWRADASWTTPVIALADDGTVLRGTIGLSGTDRVFTRETAGSAVTTSRVQFRAVDVPQAQILFLGMGINDEPLIVGGTRTVDDVKAYYQRVASRHEGHLVVWGLLDRGTSEAAGTVIGDAIRELEAWFKVTFGDAWCPVRQYLASPQALTDALMFQPGFTPTGPDTAAQAAGTVPPSFRSSAGSVHLNALGHQLQARFFQRHLTLRGLI